MAFLIECRMEGYRVLGVKSGTSKKGTAFRSVSLYKGGNTAEVSCTDSAIIPYVDQLDEMDIVNLEVRAIAGRERSYIVLTAVPERVGAGA